MGVGVIDRLVRPVEGGAVSARVVYSDGDVLSPVGTESDPKDPNENKTRQQDAQSADINVIVKRWEKTGELPVARRVGVFMDVSAMPSFQEALNTVNRANEMFMSLRADIRAKFENEPARMLDAWNNKEMREVFEEIGWLEPVEKPAVEAPKGA